MSSTEEKSKPWHDEDLLREMYHDDGLSMGEIADEFDLTSQAILYWFDQFDIPRRSMSEAKRLERAVHLRHRGYEYWADHISGKSVGVHQLLACLDHDPHKVFDPDTVTHHKTHHPLDNRPGMIEVMTRSDHNSYHRSQEIPDWKEDLIRRVEEAENASDAD